MSQIARGALYYLFFLVSEAILFVRKTIKWVVQNASTVLSIMAVAFNVAVRVWFILIAWTLILLKYAVIASAVVLKELASGSLDRLANSSCARTIQW